MEERAIIRIEFSKKNIEEMMIYNRLKEFSNPAATIKDILKGILPVNVINNQNTQMNQNVINENNEEKEEDDYEIDF